MCVHKLLEYEGVPDEPEVESLTSLLKVRKVSVYPLLTDILTYFRQLVATS